MFVGLVKLVFYWCALFFSGGVKSIFCTVLEQKANIRRFKADINGCGMSSAIK